MPKFRKKPIVVEAVQWTGGNLAEVRAFVGSRVIDPGTGYKAPIFNPINTYLPLWPHPETTTAELWVEANGTHLPIETGEWIIKDSLGFYPCKEEKFNEIYDPED